MSLETDGVILLPRFAPRSAVEVARKIVMRELERLRFLEGSKWKTREGRLGDRIKADPAFDAVVPVFYEGVEGGLVQTLVTPPQGGPWVFPQLGWHVDNVNPGAQLFVLLADLAPQGGGTLAIRGSHLSRIEPTPDTVTEMVGKAGDAYVMDMRVRHAASPNATRNPRLMLTRRYQK